MDELEEEFHYLSNLQYQGVCGVCVADSGKPGPTLGITMNTHGNEPSGLAAFNYFRKSFDIPRKLKSGRVMFVLNNINAATLYFEALRIEDPSQKEERKSRSRECDLNMNRLPLDTMNNMSRREYEVVRSRELSPIWKQFDVAMDIHSATQDSPMIVACGDIEWKLIKGFPISNIISNITNVQMNKPAIHFYGKGSDTVTLGIESGSHENDASFARSIQSCVALLVNLGMIPDEYLLPSIETYSHYRVLNGVIFPSESYELTEVFKTFAPVERGKIIAQAPGDVPDIVSPYDGCTLFGPNKLKPASIKEEVLFLSEPVEMIKV